MKYCAQCGKQVKDDAYACKYCGNILQKDAPAPKGNKSRKALLFIVCSALFVLCGLGVGVLLWNKTVSTAAPYTSADEETREDPGEDAEAEFDSSEEEQEDSESPEQSRDENEESAATSGSADASQPASAQAAAPETISDASRNGEYQVNLAIQPQWDTVSGFDDHGLARVKSGNLWGLIDRDGNYVVRPKYFSLNFFYEGLAVVDLQNQYGFIDMDGTLVVDPVWDNAFSFSEGLAVVVRNRKFGYIDTRGEIAIPLDYAQANAFADGVASVKKGDVFFFIDGAGNRVSGDYADAGSFSEGLAAVKVGKKWGYVDRSFTLVIPAQYDAAYPFVDGMGIVNQNGKQFFIDVDGSRSPAATDEVWNFAEGRATARVGQKYGYVDRLTGDFAIEPQYSDVLGFAFGMAPVKVGDNHWVYIDMDGNVVLDDGFTEAYRFSFGFGRVKKDGKTGIIDIYGNMAVPYEWKDAGIYSNGMVAVQDDGGKWGYLELSGAQDLG